MCKAQQANARPLPFILFRDLAGFYRRPYRITTDTSIEIEL